MAAPSVTGATRRRPACQRPALVVAAGVVAAAITMAAPAAADILEITPTRCEATVEVQFFYTNLRIFIVRCFCCSALETLACLGLVFVLVRRREEGNAMASFSLLACPKMRGDI